MLSAMINTNQSAIDIIESKYGIVERLVDCSGSLILLLLIMYKSTFSIRYVVPHSSLNGDGGDGNESYCNL